MYISVCNVSYIVTSERYISELLQTSCTPGMLAQHSLPMDQASGITKTSNMVNSKTNKKS